MKRNEHYSIKWSQTWTIFPRVCSPLASQRSKTWNILSHYIDDEGPSHFPHSRRRVPKCIEAIWKKYPSVLDSSSVQFKFSWLVLTDTLEVSCSRATTTRLTANWVQDYRSELSTANTCYLTPASSKTRRRVIDVKFTVIRADYPSKTAGVHTNSWTFPHHVNSL